MLSRAHGRAAGQNKGRPELADIFRQYGQSYAKTHRLSAAQQKVMRAVETCRTAELGGHLKQCDTCGFEHPTYNSCRNRHCPKCQSLAKAKWLEKQTSELLPVGYFHLVFALPHEFNRLILAHKKIGLSLLFKAVSETLLEFGQTRLKRNPRNHRRATHLGPNAQGSFSSALFGSRRRSVFGSQPLDWSTAKLSVSCHRSEPGVSGKVPGSLTTGL